MLVVVRVDFGVPILEVADTVRDLTVVLRETLGPVTPQVTVDTMHVHVNDVRAPR